MQTLLNSYLDKFKKAHRMRRRLTCALLALALLVGTGVYWQLHLTGAAASNVVYCGLEEHTHTEDCYETVLTCTLEESGGHTHTEDCYEEQTVLTCTLEESQGHTHTEDCYNEAGELICTLEESEGHTHTGDCYETEQVLTCTLEESEGHTHTEDCYETQLVCTLEEHIHTVECLTDETADVETADDRKATLPELTGVWATDVVAIARSQLGYTESVANFTLDEDGETRKGYTRYGAWAGNQYGDWDAMFASFCLRYAGVSTEDFPEATGAYAWSVTLTGAGLYERAEDCTPLPGDLVFLDEDGDGVIDAVGIVTGVDEDGGTLTVIEGDYATADGDVVAENTYALGGSAIVGYGLLPEQESLLTAASEDGDDAEEAEEESNLLTAASVDPEENLIATASEENGANELSTSTDSDLEDYVTGVSLKVLDGNEWKDVTTLSINEGDQVQVTLNYSVSNGMTGKTLTYTIPSTIAPTEEVTDGVIYDSDGKTVAGTYMITQDASGDWILTLTYSDSYDTEITFSGTVTWTGTASVETTQEDSYAQIGDTKITIVADKTTSDLSVDKTADYSNLSVSSSSTSMGYISYEVTASTILGTDGTVTITDTLNDSRNEFGRSWPGSWYDTSSVVLYVVDANGNKTEVDLSQYTVTYTNNYNDETDEALKEYQAKSGTAKYYPTLTISGLPELDADYSYVLDYNVNVNVARKDANGTKTISNTVTATDDSNNGQDSTSKQVQSEVITKGGIYDAETNTITWTITVNSDGSYDLEGFQLGDVLDTTSNILVGDIIITAADGTTKTISASDFFVTASQYQSGEGGYTFSTSDWTKTELNGKFTITYTTAAADGASGNVKNQAFLYTKDVYYGATSTRPVGRGSISKTYDASNSTTTVSGATYSWKITETAPTGQTSETLTDTIAQAVGEDGAGNTVTLPGSHYALLSTLWSEIQANLEVTIQLQGVTDAKSTTLTYAQFLAAGGTVSVVYYDENGDIATDSDAHVTSFAITVDTSNCTYYSATDPGSTCYLYKIELVYTTIADFSSAQAGYTYTISNEAASTALGTSSPYEVTFTPAGTIKKYAKTSTSTAYSEDNQSYKLGSGDDCIYYMLELTTDPGMNSAIVITDYLPEGVTLVETGTAVTVTVGTDAYNVSYTAVTQSDGTTLLTITIPGGYNSSLATGAAEGNTLYVYYAVSIAGDSYWDDAENASKTYINTASWGGLTADTNVTVTRDTSQLEKAGSVATTPNADGTYDVAYRLLVNPGAEDLSADSDEITLSDTLTLPTGATATLDYTSVKLYYYYYDYETYGDYTNDTSYGSVDLSTLTEVGNSLWSYSYDSANNTVTFTLPDEMAFLLVYTYKVDIGSANEVKVENTVAAGTQTSKTDTETIIASSSGAKVSQGKVVISKQDSTNAGTLLAGATFTLYAYNATSGEWDESVTLTTDTNGQIEVVVSKDQTDYFANKETSSVTVKTDTLYRLEETNAPSGYAVTDEINYFIFTGDSETDGAAYQAATGVSSGYSLTVTKPGGSGSETIAYSAITFGSLTTSRSVAIGDEPTTITVVKNWYSSSNVALTDTEIAEVAPNGVQLQLYQVKDAAEDTYDTTVEYGNPVTVSASSWTATWANLPKLGTETVSGVSVTYTYTYYVQEVTQGNYVTTYTNNSGITSGTIGVINKVDYVDVSVSKVWVGDEDNTSDRPANVTVVLKANGTACDTQTLNSGNSWSYTWTDLAKYSGGKEIEYTIEEVDVAYYVSEVTGDAAAGFTVTNTYIARYNLPATGGAGGWTYGMVGLVLCGGVILVLYRRRNSS